MNLQEDAARSAVVAARASYGRLLSWLAWQWRDLAAAEDALGDAFLKALETWPRDGIPASPEGWLMTTARRNLVTVARRARLSGDPAVQLLVAKESVVPESPVIPDSRLRLMFVCAHPAIDSSIRCALMLQGVLGIDAARIAGAFLVSAEAMTKRLVRAKAKIRAAGMRFEVPEAGELPARVHAVLEAIYGAYVLQDCAGTEGEGTSTLAEEALYLATLTATSLPTCAEALGLQALLLLCESRKPARLDAAGRFVPLDRQDPQRWHRPSIVHAGLLLNRAAALREPGPFQIEAAIQSAHCHRIHGVPTPWRDIERLYDVLVSMAPTVGARLAQAVAVAHARGDPAAGLRLIDAIDGERLESHQPWWAARAYLFSRAGDIGNAQSAYRHAIDLCRDPAVRAYLIEANCQEP